MLFPAGLVPLRELFAQRKSDLLWCNIFNLFSVLLCLFKLLNMNMKMHPVSLPSLHSWPFKNQNTELELLCSESEHTGELLKTPLKSMCVHEHVSQNLLCKLCTLRQEKYWHFFRFLAVAYWCLIQQLLHPLTERLNGWLLLALRAMTRFLGTHILWLPTLQKLWTMSCPKMIRKMDWG